MTKYMYTEEEKHTFERQLEKLKQENEDFRIQLMEIDLNLHAVIDMKARQAKRQLRDLRHKICADINNNHGSIVNLEKTLIEGGYNIQEAETND